jgi:hypothetical protein
MKRIQKRLVVWMIAQRDGLLCPALWDFTRKGVKDLAVRSKGASWERLEANGWTAHKVAITPVSNGDRETR